jgi:nicotinate-nucleotide adenylyltransferase
MKKIGILGGTFDPIHKGHVEMAKQALLQFDLEEIWFMPTKTPPHKVGNNITDSEMRGQMVKLAIQGMDNFIFSDFDLTRDGFIYTSDTLTLLKKDRPDLDIYFIIGGDSLNSIELWHEPAIVMKNCTLLSAVRDEVDKDKVTRIISRLKAKYDCNILPVKMNAIHVSSTEIRNNLKTNRNYDFYKDMLDKKVFDYIMENELYSK